MTVVFQQASESLVTLHDLTTQGRALSWEEQSIALYLMISFAVIVCSQFGQSWSAMQRRWTVRLQVSSFGS